MTKKYSIILPVHNGGIFVKECIDSILAQTVTDFNLEILENSSSDGTRNYLDTITDPRVRIWPSDKLLLIQENWKRIVSAPLNEFMTILGHDDLLAPDYLEIMERLIREYPDASLYQAHFKIIDSEGRLIRYCLPMPEHEYAHEFVAQRLCFHRDSFVAGYMARSSDFIRVDGIPLFHKLLYADDALYYNLIKSGYKATSPQCCFSYRLHKGSLSGNVHYGDLLQSLTSYMQFLIHHAAEDAGLSKVIERYVEPYVYKFCMEEYTTLKSVKSDNKKLQALNSDVLKIFSILDSFIDVDVPLKKWRNETKQRHMITAIKKILGWTLPYNVLDAIFNYWNNKKTTMSSK